MTIRKRIALFAGQAEEGFQNELICGFLKNAFAADLDVCVFSMYRKYQDTTNRTCGEANIFSLMNPQVFDGAVILKDSIQSENAAKNIEDRLKHEFHAPVLVVEAQSDTFPYIHIDNYHAQYALISHLIEQHGYKRIFYVAGKRWHPHAHERLQAYVDAMEAHGLPVAQNDIYYGDFWYDSGSLCAEQFLSRADALPDAVACANDQMAIGLCKALSAHGIRIPEDIAVVGFDSSEEGITSPVPLTSVQLPAYELGAYAVDYILAQIENTRAPLFDAVPRLILAQSCGCPGGYGQPCGRRREWETPVSLESYGSLANQMDETLMLCTTLTDYFETVSAYAAQLPAVEDLHLCFGSDWKYIDGSIHFPNDGYPAQMFEGVCCSRGSRSTAVDPEELFASSQMLPALDEPHDAPAAYFFTPLFFENECFGYAAVSYGRRICTYDETYRRWIRAVSRGFEHLRRNVILKQVQERLERLQNSKFALSENSYEALNPTEQAEYQLVSRILDENLLTYHFQPIVRATDGSIYAYEALMRSATPQRVSPLSIIKYAAMQKRLAEVEFATFINVLEIIRAKTAFIGTARVFINSIPGVVLRDEDVPLLDAYLTQCAEQVVVELTEEAELKDDELNRLKEYFDERRIEIAVDDYGTGYSNISNLLRYMPNYVKIDRSLLSNIQGHVQKQHFVREIIDFCHDNHILALAEGVETTDELQTVIHLGVDLIQGYYTARPAPEIVGQISEKCRSEIQRYYQERVDGHNKKLYIAGKNSRISLQKLVKDGVTDILIGQAEMVYKDIAIIGSPQLKTNIHLCIESGYTGVITLENVHFSNIKNRPCIELGENTEVTLVLSGTNILTDSGIQVPESACLTIEGDGALTLDLNAAEAYGIGNDHTARHGALYFEQDGPININTRGKSCICIGSGLGGGIHIHRGEFNLHSTNETCVGIGALTGDVEMSVHCCHIESDFAITNGLLIGSLYGSAHLFMEKSAVNHFASGNYMTVLGTLHGSSSSLHLEDSGFVLNLRGDCTTCFGARHGATRLDFENITLRLVSTGKEALAFGGTPDTLARIRDTDLTVNLNNTLGTDTLAPETDFMLLDGRQRFFVNGDPFEHVLTSSYS